MKFTTPTTFLFLTISSETALAGLRSRHPPIQSRIVGGIPAPSEAFPFFSTVNSEDALCGASLIHEDIVLTAAHCQGAFDQGVLVGVHDMDDSSDGIIRMVANEIKHPLYDEYTTSNDLMLLKLDHPVPSHIQPVEFERSATSPNAPEALTVMGFGKTLEDGDASSFLRQVDVQAVDDSTCSDQYDGQVDFNVMFCAGVPNGGKDSCQGDSGGPIIDGNNVQVGIVSWGEGCARATHSGVYTRVGAFGDWIEAKICQHSDNPPSYCDGDNADGDDNVIEARFEIVFDQYPSETSWYLTEKGDEANNGQDQVVFVGPDFWPEQFQQYQSTFQMDSTKKYAFTIEDSFGDGFLGSFVLSTVGENGETKELAAGNDLYFQHSHTVDFSKDGSNISTPVCADSTNYFFLNTDMFGNCEALSGPSNFLCSYIDVVLECPVTCGTCEAQKQVTKTECAADKEGLIDMGDQLGERSCEWLQQSMVGSGRFASACIRANVAFHCPVTCKTCESHDIRGIRGIF